MRRPDYELYSKWPRSVVDKGFTLIPNLLIEHLGDLGNTPTDFVVYVAIYKHYWRAKDLPFPSLLKLSQYTGLSTRTIKRATKRLSDAGYIKKTKLGYSTNTYDPRPVGNKLLPFATNSVTVSRSSGRKM